MAAKAEPLCVAAFVVLHILTFYQSAKRVMRLRLLSTIFNASDLTERVFRVSLYHVEKKTC